MREHVIRIDLPQPGQGELMPYAVRLMPVHRLCDAVLFEPGQGFIMPELKVVVSPILHEFEVFPIGYQGIPDGIRVDQDLMGCQFIVKAKTGAFVTDLHNPALQLNEFRFSSFIA